MKFARRGLGERANSHLLQLGGVNVRFAFTANFESGKPESHPDLDPHSPTPQHPHPHIHVPLEPRPRQLQENKNHFFSDNVLLPIDIVMWCGREKGEPRSAQNYAAAVRICFTTIIGVVTRHHTDLVCAFIGQYFFYIVFSFCIYIYIFITTLCNKQPIWKTFAGKYVRSPHRPAKSLADAELRSLLWMVPSLQR